MDNDTLESLVDDTFGDEFNSDDTNNIEQTGNEPQQEPMSEDYNSVINEAMSSQNEEPQQNTNELQNAQQVPAGFDRQKLQPLHNSPDVFADPEGNLVDINGTLIAQKGMQRRMYHENSRLTTDVDQLREENQRLMSRYQELEPIYKGFQESAEIFQRHGITPAEVNEAAQLIAMFKVNPVAAAKEGVAKAMALGHNATEILGDDVGNSVDMAALKHIISNQTGGQTAPANNANGHNPDQGHENARVQYETFISRFPDAVHHEDAIVELMQKESGITTYDAFDRLRTFAATNNLDIRSPLGPQIKQRAIQHAQTTRRQPSKPLMSGRGNNAAVHQTSARPMNIKPANADDDWSAIVRGAMQESHN